jgi:hypothetical protein
MSGRTRRIARILAVKNALVVLVALFLAFALCEGIVRLFYDPENLGTVIRFDENLGWSLDPGAHLHSRDHEHDLDYRIRINSLGLRDREIVEKKPPGVRRVLLVGDSFVFGTGIEARWRTSDILGRALQDNVEVINAGVSGWGTGQELVHYESTLRQLEPDVVILTMMMANDVINNTLDHLFLGDASKPRFTLEGEKLTWSGPVERPPKARPNLRSMLKKSHLLVLAKRRIVAMRSKPAQDIGVAAESGLEEEWIRGKYSHWLAYEHDYPEELEQGWAVTERLLDRFAADCEADGVEFIVFAFPLKIEVDDAWRERLLTRAQVSPKSLDLKKPYRRLSEYCESRGIEFLYPLDEFRAAAQRRNLYLMLDGHPSRYGHFAAAGVLLKRLNAYHNYDFAISAIDEPLFAELQ